MQIVAGESLEEGNGTGDFDAGLTVLSGPGEVGIRYLLGGVADIQIGKQSDRHIVLPGTLVSRGHCHLSRVDFGPSRWKLVDGHSTNGLSVNGTRVAEHELQDGDVITIGEYDLEFRLASPAELEMAPEPVAPAASVRPPRAAPAPSAAHDSAPTSCPSCERTLPGSAKICVDCGINLKTGRPVLTSQDVDEDALYAHAEQWIWWVSLLVWITPTPIPIRSQAFGTRKPYAIWTIATATVLASITFFIAQKSGAGDNFMLWRPGQQAVSVSSVVPPEEIHQIAKHMTPEERNALQREFDPQGRLSDDELVERELDKVLMEKLPPRGRFEWYQLFTHAFLHDTTSIYRFAMHLGGNLLFMLVFGTRVNALIGDLATAIAYPILAVCAAAVHLMSLGNGPSGPMLGASGAIMGLAGMYLILFPAHRVYCAMWISFWYPLGFRRLYGCKIFQMRGFWILLIYFAYDILMNAIGSLLGHHGGGGVAHWAHIGGFLTGAAIGLGLLFSRQFNTHGGDVLSVTLGRYAWPLIGKPARWHLPPAAGLPRAVSLNFQ
ncbi:MAG TPA: rhomboid family intramembrane serine protease [Tepidisphaeraceae bacterium]|nr:rhomboid family intramembrane serine protease [Tepidisphaeraceae bacterium]